MLFLAPLFLAVTGEVQGETVWRPISHSLLSGSVNARLTKDHSEYLSPEHEIAEPFNELLLSWNARVPEGCGFTVELRVARSPEKEWSPFLFVGSWGGAVPDEKRLTECPQGKIDVDFFHSSQRFDRCQYRIRGFFLANSNELPVIEIDYVAISTSDTSDQPRTPLAQKFDRTQREIRIGVPFRSQKWEKPELASRICSPTSLAMVMEYLGEKIPTSRVAEACYDREHDIYGNWPRSLQAIYPMGSRGILDRFCCLEEAYEYLARGYPIIGSIRVEPGQLRGAPYASTKGHLLVLRGFDAKGDILVNDPAAQTEEKGRATYAAKDIQKVWIENGKGTAYLLFPGKNSLQNIGTRHPDLRFALPYARSDNFTKTALYPVERVYLRDWVAERLWRVVLRLRQKGYDLKLLDAYRPFSVQKKMWAILPDKRYVADPAKGSRHNRGAAVDVTLTDKEGKELEMPCPFDTFDERAHRDYQGGSEASRIHRDILQSAMEFEGFVGLPTEWWHFDDPNWENYPVLDIPLDELFR